MFDKLNKCNDLSNMPQSLDYIKYEMYMLYVINHFHSIHFTLSVIPSEM